MRQSLFLGNFTALPQDHFGARLASRAREDTFRVAEQKDTQTPTTPKHLGSNWRRYARYKSCRQAARRAHFQRAPVTFRWARASARFEDVAPEDSENSSDTPLSKRALARAFARKFHARKPTDSDENSRTTSGETCHFHAFDGRANSKSFFSCRPRPGKDSFSREAFSTGG